MRRMILVLAVIAAGASAVLLARSPALRARLVALLEAQFPVTAERLAFERLPTCALPAIGDTSAWLQ